MLLVLSRMAVSTGRAVGRYACHAAFAFALLGIGLVLLPQEAFAQDFTKIPTIRLYQAQIIQGGPISEDGDALCAMAAAQFNQKGTWATSWYEYTEAEFQIRPSLGEGCKYIVIDHGMPGYPEGYTWEAFRQNDVLIKLACPVGYSQFTQYFPDGSGQGTRMCSRATFVPTKPCPTCDADRNVGNPVSAGTGLKIERVTDAALGDMTIGRTFRSGARWSYLSAPMEFGLGWYSQISARIEYTPATTYTTAGVYALRPDGTVIPFLPLSDGSWKADVDMTTYTLTQVSDSAGATLGWNLVTADGSKETYNAKGMLLSVERNGAMQMELRRDGVGHLLAIADRQGRVATVTFDAKGHIGRLVLPDGNDVVYVYDTQGRLTSVTSANSTRRYEYVDISGQTGAFLSKVIDEANTTFAQFGYDTSGRAISTQHAGAVDAVNLAYRNGGNDVDVSFPTGRTETYHFDLQLGSRKLRTAATTCAGCSIPTESRSDDVNGYPDLSTDRRSVITDRDFNAQGLEIQRIEAANQANKRTIQTDWDTARRVPTERRTYDASGVLIGKEAWAYNSRGQVLTHSVMDP